MSPLQRMIKYAAMLFAVILAGSIITSVIYGIIRGFNASLFDAAEISSSNKSTIQYISKEYQYDKISQIKIGNGFANVEIEARNDIEQCEVTLDRVDDSYSVEFDDGILEIDSSRGGGLFTVLEDESGSGSFGKIRIVVPQKKVLASLSVDNGRGDFKLEDVEVDTLSINGGSGQIRFRNAKVNEAGIVAGVGDIDFNDCTVSNMELKGGIGEFDFTGILAGKNVINGNIGNIDIRTDYSQDEYQISVSDGIGTTYLNGEEVGNLTGSETEGTNVIDVDEGIGDIYLRFD